MAQRLALIVAPRYLSNQWLTYLDGTRLLPTHLQEVLTAYGHYDQIITDLADKEVKRSQLRSVLKRFFQNQGELLFYFYGHGIRRDPQEGLLATSDSEPDDEGVPMREVIALADTSPASEVVLIFDCCHAGAVMPATATVVPQNMRPDRGRVLIAACAEHEQGWETRIDERRKLGALSACVLEGLNGAAQNSKGTVTAASLGQYVSTAFTDWRQHPIWTQGGSTALSCKLTWGFTVASLSATLPSKERCDYYEHLKYPTHYLPRHELLDQVRQALLTGAGNAALTSAIQADALHGMGGIGKTVMARALCDDPAVRERFSNGILVATLGSESSEADLRRWLREWINTLGGIIAETAPSLTKLTNTLAELLYDRACLLILDDVWRKEQVAPFLISAPRCRLLVTTRDAELARDLGAQILPVPELNEGQAIALLEQWATPALTGVERDLKRMIVNRLGRLALAVRLAGTQLRSQNPSTWLHTFDVRNLKARRLNTIHDSLATTFSLSLDELDTTSRRLYAALIIFREDEPIHTQAVNKLWQGLARYNIQTSLNLLYDLEARALLQLTLTPITDQLTGERFITIHDLLRDFLRLELDEALTLQTHQALLSAYQETWQGNGWHTAQDDGYLYNHLAYHLSAVTDLQPTAIDKLNAIFANDEWMQVRVAANDYTYDGFLNDLSMLWERLTKRALTEIAEDSTNFGFR